MQQLSSPSTSRDPAHRPRHRADGMERGAVEELVAPTAHDAVPAAERYRPRGLPSSWTSCLPFLSQVILARMFIFSTVSRYGWELTPRRMAASTVQRVG